MPDRDDSGLGCKIYLELPVPSEDDERPADERIREGIRQAGITGSVRMPLAFLQKLYPLCDEAEWKVTVSLSWNGEAWDAVNLESGDTSGRQYALAVDLGSTAVVARLIDLATGEMLGQESTYNAQIRFGEDILQRIFYAHEGPAWLKTMQTAALMSIREVCTLLQKRFDIAQEDCLCMTVAGNACMIHFLLGLDAFCVFHSPYAMRTLDPGFIPAGDLGLPLHGNVYIFPALANYVGGDIISGLLATGLYRSKEVSLFFDVGTNGELVVGNRDFLLCGAGAAGPALEGGVVKTGMRASEGAVEEVQLKNGEFCVSTVEDAAPRGICGSGIIDLLAELFLNGWVDIKGKLQTEKSRLIALRHNDDSDEDEYAVEYASGLWFYQSDIDEFIRTKAAAVTMMEYMLQETGFSTEDIRTFYMAGAFGAHVNKESAVTIGMYPDVPREKIVPCGNTSLEGASRLLRDRSLLNDIPQMLSLMTYVQYGAIDNFLTLMEAAAALPHTDQTRYPSVMKKREGKAGSGYPAVRQSSIERT